MFPVPVPVEYEVQPLLKLAKMTDADACQFVGQPATCCCRLHQFFVVVIVVAGVVGGGDKLHFKRIFPGIIMTL